MTGAGAESLSEFWKWIGQAIAVGVGWYVVHKLSASRDRDKSRREMVVRSADQLIDALSALLSDAHRYHLGPRSVEAELRIKMALQDMAMRTSGLSEVVRDRPLLAPCSSEIAGVRRSVTGRHFEDEHEGPLQEGSDQVQVVAEAILRAKRAFLRLKHCQFSDS